MRHVRTLPYQFLETARLLITEKSWWDTVDILAARVVGPVVADNTEHLSALSIREATRHLVP